MRIIQSTQCLMSCFLRCRLPNEFPNASFQLDEDTLNSSFPWHEQKQRYSNCTMYVDGEVEYCDSYIYDHTKYESSAYFEVSTKEKCFVSVFCSDFKRILNW